MTSFQCFKKQFNRELVTHLRRPRMIVNAALFFLMITVFFPLTMPANSEIIKQVAPGFIWMAVLLVMLLASERLFQQDYELGLVEQWLASGYPLNLILGAKMLVHWLLIILPLLFLSPCLYVLFGFSWHEIELLLISLVVGTPTILCLCTLSAAFSTGMAQRGMVMALILLPLTVPVLIFGSSVLNSSMAGGPVLGQLALLLSISLLAVGFLPFAIAAVIRISLAD